MILYRLPAVFIALTLHELAHGYVALCCGDPTAQMLGRLSFHPLRHLHPLGTLCMFLFGVGWAKPVPINPRNFKHFRRDELLVSLAGVTVNFLLFFVTLFVMTALHPLIWKPELLAAGPLGTAREFLSMRGVNFGFLYSNQNLVALQEAFLGQVYVDDAFFYLKTPWLMYVQRFLMDFMSVNLGLCLFNLLPIPPLDGYRLFNNILFRGKLRIPPRVMKYVTMGLLVLLVVTDFISELLGSVMFFVQDGVLSLALAVFGLG